MQKIQKSMSFIQFCCGTSEAELLQMWPKKHCGVCYNPDALPAMQATVAVLNQHKKHKAQHQIANITHGLNLSLTTN